MKKPMTVLVSADAGLIRFLSEAVHSTGHSSLEVVTGLDDARAQAANDDLAIVIVHLSESDDIQEVARLREYLTQCGSPGALLIVCDRYRASEARDSILFGAIDYLPRPLDLNQIAFLTDMQVLRVLRRSGLSGVKKPARKDQQLRALGAGEAFLYESGSVGQRVADMIRRVAPSSSTVVLGGETGSGKSRVARLIHELSQRQKKPFLAVNCGALSASLIESEMFGHAKGAFTGADAVHVGKFTEAGEGTLFLDEIDTLPPPLQAKLLRAVEERVFEPVGSNKTQPMRARLIVASNRPLEQEVKEGRFRSDLFFRLNVISIDVPPLRARGHEVIQELSREFLASYSTQSHRKIAGMSQEFLAALCAHDWPGNVRELRNIIERAVALSDGETIGLLDLPGQFINVAEGEARDLEFPISEPVPLQHLISSKTESRGQEEIRLITEALERHGNNRRRAAADLGISRMTLYNKLHKYRLDVPGILGRHSLALIHA